MHLFIKTRLTVETSQVVSNLTPYAIYRVTVSCIPALRVNDGRLDDGRLVARGFWSDSANIDARTLPDGKSAPVWPFRNSYNGGCGIGVLPFRLIPFA